MTFRVGDAVFGRGGQPAVVLEKDVAKGEMKVSRDQKAIEKNHRFGYINGLKEAERSEFLTVMDEVAEVGEPREKMAVLQTKIHEMKEDPRQHHLVGYLESELFHIMNLNNIAPREYTLNMT